MNSFACQQLAADRARVRLEQILSRASGTLLERDVAAEAAAEAAHQRVVEVVVRAVERARGQVPRLVADGAACRAARGRCRRGSSRAGGCGSRSGRASRSASAACPSRSGGREPLRWRRTGVALRVPFEDWRRTDVTTGPEASQCAWQRPPTMGRCAGAASPGSAGAASGRGPARGARPRRAAVPAGRLRRGRRLLRPLRLPDHRAAAPRRHGATAASGSPTSTSAAARRILPAAVLTLVVTDLVAHQLLNLVRARQAVERQRLGGVLHGERAFRARGQRLLRPAAAALAGTALLDARGRGAVLPRLAGRARGRAGGSVPAAAAALDRARRGRRLARVVDPQHGDRRHLRVLLDGHSRLGARARRGAGDRRATAARGCRVARPGVHLRRRGRSSRARRPSPATPPCCRRSARRS